MSTFSQIVDKIILETKRPDMKSDIISYLNQTMRELHTEPTRGNAAHYETNLKEDVLLSDSDSNFYWEIPKPQVFQGIRSVRYDSLLDRHGNQVWAEPIQPSRAMNGVDYFFYRSGSRFYFRGYGGLQKLISMAWYEFTPSLDYYAKALRPAEWSNSTGWTYLTAYDTDETTRAVARALVGNWILDRWDTVVEEGLRAKVYKRASDDSRARTCYSLFKQMHQNLYTSEIGDITGSWAG
jgi:hypothetical protein